MHKDIQKHTHTYIHRYIHIYIHDDLLIALKVETVRETEKLRK